MRGDLSPHVEPGEIGGRKGERIEHDLEAVTLDCQGRGNLTDGIDDACAAPGSPGRTVLSQDHLRLRRRVTGRQVEIQISGKARATARAETEAILVREGVVRNPVLPETRVARKGEEQAVRL